jgi:tRNA pseudouridine55 synthase
VAEGFVLVDKPGGWTSHDVVGRCRRIFGIRRIGHAGTLDPMATGLLVIALGRATRLLRFVQESAKTYEATAVFGVATDSLDADGAILTCEEMRFGEAELRDVSRRFLGVIPQVPPMVSAIKVEGRRLYQLARAGLEVDRPSRPVKIHSLDILEVSPGIYPEVSFRVTCGSGTYIRVLADDMARRSEAGRISPHSAAPPSVRTVWKERIPSPRWKKPQPRERSMRWWCRPRSDCPTFRG